MPRRFSKKPKVSTLAKRVRKLERASELKHYGYYVNGQTVSVTGTMTQLSQVSQSDLITGRTGNEVVMKSITTRINVQAGSGGKEFRAIVFVDKSTDGSTPTLNELLQTGSGRPTLDPLNFTFRHRFKVLHDKLIPCDTTNYTTYSMRLYRRLGHKCRWNGSAGNSPLQGNIWILIVSDAVTTYPVCSFHSHMTFIDP